ncbi:unannotated protein [freshwater metagenome]|uniref:Unannotated protein n=1 Tax=freshwater metagenome TaxID=449393 RepID=A0A6J6IJD9_9ZZZZ
MVAGLPTPTAFEKSTGIRAIFIFPVGDTSGREGNPFAPAPVKFLVSFSWQLESGSAISAALSGVVGVFTGEGTVTMRSQAMPSLSLSKEIFFL